MTLNEQPLRIIPKSLGHLRSLSDDEIAAAVLYECKNLGRVTLTFWLAELARREQARATKSMGWLTWAIAGMTLVMTIATILNVWLFAAAAG